MNELLTSSAVQLAAGIQNGQWSSVEVVQAHIEHIQQVNPRLNAVVVDRFDVALQEALQADRCPKAQRPLFHGVPCTIKECFALQGMPQTSGLLSRKQWVAKEDAVVVQRLRRAGFIPLGVTNVSELCMWMESHNLVYGRTKNPYDVARTAGGSSGGEGAIVGAGGSPVGLGSDIGGSIRMPAFFNGVFGHKCSPNLVDNRGQFPCAQAGARQLLSTGPLCRKSEDLLPLLHVMAPEHFPLQSVEYQPQNLRVFVIKDDGRIAVEDDLIAAQERAAAWFSKKGVKIVEIKPPDLRFSAEIWLAAMDHAGEPSFESLATAEQGCSLRRQILRSFTSRAEHTFPALGLILIERLAKLLSMSLTSMLEHAETLRYTLRSLLGSNGILLYPSHPVVAPLHNHALRRPWNCAYTGIFNVLGLPATQVPMGLNSHGLPLGVQVVADRNNDALCLQVATWLEQAFGGWCPPALAEIKT